MATAAATTYEETRSSSFKRWWAGTERAEVQACPAPDCGSTGKTEFDEYCDNGHLMFFADQPTVQRIAINAVRVAIAFLAAIAAVRESSWPLYAVSAVIGLAVIILPLRRFAMARLVAAFGWIISLGIAAGVREDVVAAETARELAVVLVLVLLGVAVAAVFLDADVGAEDAVARAIGASGVGGLGMVLVGAFMSTSLGERLLSAPASVNSLFLYAGALTALGAVSAAAACGIVRGIRTANYDVAPLIDRPRRRAAPQISSRSTPQRPHVGFGPQLVFVVHVFAARIIRHIADALNVGLRVLWRTVFLVSLSVVGAINAGFIFVLRVLCAVGSAVAQTMRLLGSSIAGASWPLRGWLRRVAGTAAALIAAAVMAGFASARFGDYLVSGGLKNAAGALLAAALLPIALGSIWWTVTSESVAVVRASIGELLADAGPYAFLTMLTIGWALGVAGWMGIGEIRPGILTYLGTAIVAAAALYTYVGPKGSRRSDPQVVDTAS